MSIGGIGGYNAFAQPLIQERLANQRVAVQNDSGGASNSVSKREEVFRSLLNASNITEETNAGRTTDRPDAGAVRGKFVDLSV